MRNRPNFQQESSHYGPAAAVRASHIPMVGFILLPGFTLLSYSVLTDIFLCHKLAGNEIDPRLCWEVAGQNKTVRSQCGVDIPTTMTLEAVAECDHLIVIGGRESQPIAGRGRLIDCLRKADARGATLGGVGSGLLLMIDAGFFDDIDCASSWYEGSDRHIRFAGARERPGVSFVVAERRLSCAGAFATMELGNFLIASDQASKTGNEQGIAAISSTSPSWPASTAVDSGLCARAASSGIDPRVRRTIALIEENLETPRCVSAIANTVGLSKRQLERLFHQAVGGSIQHYSRVLRVTYGLWLLTQTEWPITEIALEAGFSDSSHFNRLCRATFDKVPSDIRRGGASNISVPLRWQRLFRRNLIKEAESNASTLEIFASGTFATTRSDWEQNGLLCHTRDNHNQATHAEPAY